MINAHQYKFETMTAAWLLPFVSCVVAAAYAGVIGNSMETLHERVQHVGCSTCTARDVHMACACRRPR